VTAADGQSLTQTMNMAYNDGGELTALVYPDGETLTSQYDVNGRFQSAYFGTSNTPDPVPFLASEVAYTDIGQLSSMAVGGTGPKNGGATTTPSIFTTSFGYDAIQRPLSVSATLTSTSQTVWSQARTYDNVGNVLGLSTTVPSISGGTKTDVESFCYDALDRLVWAGDTGTPSGGDHCGAAPSGTTINTYQQSYSYDDLDRMTSGPAGSMTYGAPNHVHAVTGLSTVANQYATYNADGEMVCRNIASGTGHACGGSSPNGAAMTYDAAGRLATWTAPSGTTASDSFLYDNAGNRVLQTTSNTSNGTTTTTDTITFDGYTETSITNGTTTTIKYYSLNGQKVAMHWNGVLYYLLSDGLGSSTVALKDDGTTQAAQLFAPYGAVRHSSGTMPTTYNFTGQRLDSETGLLYYNFRYYDPVSGRFVRADTVDTNAGGKDPYAYVGDSPENKADPTGHDGWGIFATIAIAVAVVGVVAVVAVVAAPVVIVSAAVIGEVLTTGTATVAAAAATTLATESATTAAVVAGSAIVGAATYEGTTIAGDSLDGQMPTESELWQQGVTGGIAGVLGGPLTPIYKLGTFAFDLYERYQEDQRQEQLTRYQQLMQQQDQKIAAQQKKIDQQNMAQFKSASLIGWSRSTGLSVAAATSDNASWAEWQIQENYFYLKESSFYNRE